MADQRKPREQDSRKSEQRKSDAWFPADELPVPHPEKGYSFRWVRISAGGSADNRNVSKKFREGYVPLSVADHPELKGLSDDDRRYPDGVVIGGLLLCKIADEVLAQRKAYYEQHAQRQIDSVNNTYMKDTDPRMPKHNESSSRTDFRKG